LGDSIFDNGAYTLGGTDVAAQLGEIKARFAHRTVASHLTGRKIAKVISALVTGAKDGVPATKIFR
jgi:hypothetical protein